MLHLLNVNQPIKVNGQIFPDSKSAWETFKDYQGELTIVLNFKQDIKSVQTGRTQCEKPNVTEVTKANEKEYRIKVRQYMTRKSSPEFDFMKKFNNDNPMPMRVMVGKVLQETKGMVKMELHGRPEPSSYCLHCGKTLTHPVSLLYGIGPICGQHFHVNPLEDESQLDAYMEVLKEKMNEIRWTGWIIKSAIEEKEVI